MLEIFPKKKRGSEVKNIEGEGVGMLWPSKKLCYVLTPHKNLQSP